jgi:hypothetical protein
MPPSPHRIPVPRHRSPATEYTHNALTPLNGTILGQSKTRRSHGLRKTPGHQVNAVLVPVVPSPDLRELSGRGRSLFHPVGQSEEEYPPTRVIDACRHERRFSLHHTRFLSRVDPNQSLPLSPHQTRESHGGRGRSPHRPGRSWARRPGVRPMTLASMSQGLLPYATPDSCPAPPISNHPAHLG